MSFRQALALAYLALTLVTLLVYGLDKLRAKRGGRRVSERTLHGLALLGGFAGTWLGMRLFRHKTLHPSFWVISGLAAALHLGFWGWWLFG